MRFVTPVLFWLAGGWVWWTNQHATDRVVVFPGMDLFSEDPQEQGLYSALLCFAVGGWLFLWDIVAVLRKKRDRVDG